MTGNKQQLPIEVEGNKEGSTNASVNKEEVAKQQGDSCIGSQDASRTEEDKPSPSLSSTTTIFTASTSTGPTKNVKVATTNDSSDQVTSRDASDAALKHDEFASKDKNQSQPPAKNDRLDSDNKKTKMDDTPIGNNSKPDSNNNLSAASVPQTTKGGTAVVNTSNNTAVVTTAHTAADKANENHTKVGGDSGGGGGGANSIASETVVKPTAAQPELTSSSSNLPPNKQSSSGVVQVPPVSTKKVEPAIFATLSQMDQVPNNILKLLQTYGPLTATEIAYNIPPTELSIPSILEVMRVLNVIHYHEDGGYYYFHNGEIRADTIYPSEIVDIVQDTQDEIKETMERIQLLKEELQQNVHIQNRARSAREFLKNLVGKYGGERGIRSDPVYATALKTLNVDLGIKRKVAEVESIKRKKITRKKKKEEGTSTGSTNKTVVGDGSTVECGDNNDENKSSLGLKTEPVAVVMKDSERKHEDGDVTMRSPKNDMKSMASMEQVSKVMAVEQPPLQPGGQQPQPQQSLAKQPGQPQKQQKPLQPGQPQPQQQPLAKQPGQPQQQRQPLSKQPGQPQPQQQPLAKQPGQPQPQQQRPLAKQPGQPQQQRQASQPGQPQPQQQPLAKQPGQPQPQQRQPSQPGQPQPQQQPLAKQPGQPQQQRQSSQPGQPQPQQQPLTKQPEPPQQQRQSSQPGQPQQTMVKQSLAKQPGQPQQ